MNQSQFPAGYVLASNHLFVLIVARLAWGAAQGAAQRAAWHLETNSLAWHLETNCLVQSVMG
jgi:hypothetical protein